MQARHQIHCWRFHLLRPSLFKSAGSHPPRISPCSRIGGGTTSLHHQIAARVRRNARACFPSLFIQTKVRAAPAVAVLGPCLSGATDSGFCAEVDGLHFPGRCRVPHARQPSCVSLSRSEFPGRTRVTTGPAGLGCEIRQGRVTASNPCPARGERPFDNIGLINPSPRASSGKATRLSKVHPVGNGPTK